MYGGLSYKASGFKQRFKNGVTLLNLPNEFWCRLKKSCFKLWFINTIFMHTITNYVYHGK